MCALPAAQLEDLNRGTFGFVQLAYDRVSRQQVAIKIIERGDKVYRSNSAALTFAKQNRSAALHSMDEIRHVMAVTATACLRE